MVGGGRRCTRLESERTKYGLATKYYGVTHPSLPNYVATISGSNWGSSSDDVAQADQGYFKHLSLTDSTECSRHQLEGIHGVRAVSWLYR
jgi:phosphatidylinositol-3-phosphatase